MELENKIILCVRQKERGRDILQVVCFGSCTILSSSVCLLSVNYMISNVAQVETLPIIGLVGVAVISGGVTPWSFMKTIKIIKKHHKQMVL